MERPITVHPRRKRIFVILGISLAGILAAAVVTAMILYIYVRKHEFSYQYREVEIEEYLKETGIEVLSLDLDSQTITAALPEDAFNTAMNRFLEEQGNTVEGVSILHMVFRQADGRVYMQIKKDGLILPVAAKVTMTVEGDSLQFGLQDFALGTMEWKLPKSFIQGQMQWSVPLDELPGPDWVSLTGLDWDEQEIHAQMKIDVSKLISIFQGFLSGIEENYLDMMLAKEDHGALLDRIQAIYGGAAMTEEDALAVLQDFFNTQSQLFPMLSILDEATSEQILQRYAYLVRPGTDYQAYSELRAELSLQMKATVAGYVERGLYSMLGKTVGEPLTLFSIKGTPYDPSHGTLYNLETVLAANPVEDRYKPLLEGMRLYYRIEDGSCSVLTEANNEGQILVVSNGSYLVISEEEANSQFPYREEEADVAQLLPQGNSTRQDIEAAAAAGLGIGDIKTRYIAASEDCAFGVFTDGMSHTLRAATLEQKDGSWQLKDSDVTEYWAYNRDNPAFNASVFPLNTVNDVSIKSISQAGQSAILTKARASGYAAGKDTIRFSCFIGSHIYVSFSGGGECVIHVNSLGVLDDCTSVEDARENWSLPPFLAVQP